MISKRLSVFQGSIVSNVIVSRCLTIVMKRIGSMELETQPTGNSILVISYVNLILTIYGSKTHIHLSYCVTRHTVHMCEED